MNNYLLQSLGEAPRPIVHSCPMSAALGASSDDSGFVARSDKVPNKTSCCGDGEVLGKTEAETKRTGSGK